jgi:hypothetical protein
MAGALSAFQPTTLDTNSIFTVKDSIISLFCSLSTTLDHTYNKYPTYQIDNCITLNTLMHACKLKLYKDNNPQLLLLISPQDPDNRALLATCHHLQLQNSIRNCFECDGQFTCPERTFFKTCQPCSAKVKAILYVKNPTYPALLPIIRR